MKNKSKYILALSLFIVSAFAQVQAQNCDVNATDNRRTQVLVMTVPFSFVTQMTMHRAKSYNGTAFLIHPRVLLTAGHNLRKRNNIFTTRVKSLTLRFGATNSKTNLYETSFATTQFDNIYTHINFNENYSIEQDYGIVILPDEVAYNKIGGCFKLTVCDTSVVKKNQIYIGAYPGDRDFCTQWQDSTSNFFFYKSYLHYDFSTEHGASGAPIWYDAGAENRVFAIHTNGDGFHKFKCTTATVITQAVYDDIVRFCLSKGIDITK